MMPWFGEKSAGETADSTMMDNTIPETIPKCGVGVYLKKDQIDHKKHRLSRTFLMFFVFRIFLHP